MKKIYLAAAAAMCLLGIMFVTYRLSKSRSFQLFGDITRRVDTAEKVVALTLDDAPGEECGKVLQILASKKVKATFYVIGQSAEEHPEMLKRIIADGHEIGNHSYSHHRMILKAPGTIAYEIEAAEKIIREAGYAGEITFRPPNGKKLFALPLYLSRRGMRTIMWDVEPDTYFQGNATDITAHTLSNAKPGSIILIHPFCDKACEADREALPAIIDGLSAKGYRFVTVTQLLSYEKE